MLSVCFAVVFVQVQRKTARAAEERYRQEVEAHAGAIAALREAEDAQDVRKWWRLLG